MSLMPLDDTINVDEVLLEKMKVTAGREFGANMMRDMRIEKNVDFIAHSLIYSLKTHVLAQVIAKDDYHIEETRKVEHFATWWDHFKHDHMPGWFTKKFPVKHRTESILFYKVLKLTRKESYPMSSLVMEKNKHFMGVMGPPVIKDEVVIE